MSSRPVDHSVLAIAGYTGRLSALPGQSVTVHASSTHAEGALRLVRLGHEGKTFTKEPAGPSAPIELAHRDVAIESYGLVDALELPAAPLALSAWVWASLLPGAEEATLLATDDLALSLDAAGTVALRVGGQTVRSSATLQVRRWYEVACGLDADRRPFVEVRSQRVTGDSAVEWTPRSGSLVLGRGLNGKLDDVIAGSLRLDFAHGISTWLIHDGGSAAVGRVVGLPTRGAQGRRWDGTQYDWRYAPDHFSAISFHTDDQGDQEWPVTATVELPDDLPGGLYAVELSAGDDTDHLPVVVRRGAGEPAALLVLLPTLTYLAYALEHGDAPHWQERCREPGAEFARANGYHSLYDLHADGSLVVLASLHRPLLGVTRPEHRFRFSDCEHGLGGDLHLLGWLARHGFAFDIATDHDLDAEGVDLLSPYRGVLTGHHPEYWSGRMLDGVEGYLAAGGNLAYLGGNGFCWTTVIDPNDPSVAELRRGPRGFLWGGEVGEDHFQLGGDPGGLWNACGRPEAAIVGTTWASTGMADGVPFRRTAASFDPRVAHLFEGIGDDEPIGERGAFLGAAASFEVDFANTALGTPDHALVVATAAMPDGYGIGLPSHRLVGGEDNVSRRRADMTWFETEAGGAVFSASSMGWIGALSHDGDRNAVSRLTANLLRSFVESGS